jgi:hypothetical protein
MMAVKVTTPTSKKMKGRPSSVPTQNSCRFGGGLNAQYRAKQPAESEIGQRSQGYIQACIHGRTL